MASIAPPAHPKRNRLSITLLAIAIFAVQPLYGLLAEQIANAAAVHSTDLSGWDFSETRAKGHKELVTNGLKIWTDSNDSDSKVAGYYSNGVNFELDNATDFALAWTGTTPAPGGQLVVDLDNDGDLDGILVVESAYGGIGGTLWLPSLWGQSTGSAIDTAALPRVAGGGGTYNGTLANWNTAFPNAKVKAVGFSLGSGVLGSGVITKLTAGGTDYSFALAPLGVPILVAPANNGFVKGASVTNSWNAVAGADHYIYQSYNDAAASSVRWTQNVRETSKSAANVADATFWWRVKAVSASGQESAWSELRKVTVDSTNPATTIAVSAVANGRFTVSGTATDSAALNRVYVQLVNRTTGKRCGGETINLIGKGTTAQWSKEYNVTALYEVSSSPEPARCGDSDYAAHVSVVDMAGNSGTAGWTNNFFVDTTAPAAPAGLKWTTSNGVVMTSGGATKLADGVASWDQNAESDIDHYVYKYWNDIPGNQYKAGSEYRVQLSSTRLPGVFNQGEGVHHFCVEAVDKAGSVSPCTEFTITYDLTVPVLILNQIDATTDQTPVISGTASEAAVAVTVFIDGVEQTTATSDENGQWSWQVTPALAPGSYAIEVKAVDKAGNAAEGKSMVLVIKEPAQNNEQGGGTTTNPPTSPGNTNPQGNTDTNESPTPQGESVSEVIAANIPGFAATVLPQLSTDQPAAPESPASSDSSGTVLGEQDVPSGTPLKDTDVLGAMDSKVFGLVWYWWLIILAALVGGWLLLAAAIRRSRAEEE